MRFKKSDWIPIGFFLGVIFISLGIALAVISIYSVTHPKPAAVQDKALAEPNLVPHRLYSVTGTVQVDTVTVTGEVEIDLITSYRIQAAYIDTILQVYSDIDSILSGINCMLDEFLERRGEQP